MNEETKSPTPREFLRRSVQKTCGCASYKFLDNLDRESAYSELYEALERQLNQHYGCACGVCVKSRTALAHARGEK